MVFRIIYCSFVFWLYSCMTIYYAKNGVKAISEHIFTKYSNSIKKLLAGEYRALSLEKLHNTNPAIYSIRASKKARLLLTLVNGAWCIIEELPNHEYQNSRFLQAGILRSFLQNIDEHTFVSCNEVPELIQFSTSEELDLAPGFFYQNKILIPTDTQNQTLQYYGKPKIIIGAPGTGKTFVDALELERKSDDGLVCFIGPGNVVQKMKMHWNNIYPEDESTLFFTPFEFLVYLNPQNIEKAEVDETFFTNWWKNNFLKARKNRTGLKETWPTIKPSQFYEEFRIISGYYGSDDGLRRYSALGKKESLFPREMREVLYCAYRSFQNELQATSHIDPNLILLSDIEEDKKFHKIIVDESHRLSRGYVLTIVNSVECLNNLVFSYDLHQCIFDKIASLSFLQSVLNVHDNELLYLGNQSLRCAKKVAEFAAKTQRLSKITAGGVTHKLSRLSEIQSQELEASDNLEAGVINWFDDLNREEESLSLLREQAFNGALIVITYEQFFDAVREIFGESVNIFTPENSQGLEWPHVVFFYPFEKIEFYEANNRFIINKRTGNDFENKGRASNLKALDYVRPFVEIVVGITRSEKILTIVQPRKREINHLIDYLYNALNEQSEEKQSISEEQTFDSILLTDSLNPEEAYRRFYYAGQYEVAEKFRIQHGLVKIEEVSKPGCSLSPSQLVEQIEDIKSDVSEKSSQSVVTSNQNEESKFANEIPNHKKSHAKKSKKNRKKENNRQDSALGSYEARSAVQNVNLNNDKGLDERLKERLNQRLKEKMVLKSLQEYINEINNISRSGFVANYNFDRIMNTFIAQDFLQLKNVALHPPILLDQYDSKRTNFEYILASGYGVYHIIKNPAFFYNNLIFMEDFFSIFFETENDKPSLFEIALGHKNGHRLLLYFLLEEIKAKQADDQYESIFLNSINASHLNAKLLVGQSVLHFLTNEKWDVPFVNPKISILFLDDNELYAIKNVSWMFITELLKVKPDLINQLNWFGNVTYERIFDASNTENTQSHDSTNTPALLQCIENTENLEIPLFYSTRFEQDHFFALLDPIFLEVIPPNWWRRGSNTNNTEKNITLLFILMDKTEYIYDFLLAHIQSNDLFQKIPPEVFFLPVEDETFSLEQKSPFHLLLEKDNVFAAYLIKYSPPEILAKALDLCLLEVLQHYPDEFLFAMEKNPHLLEQISEKAWLYKKNDSSMFALLYLYTKNHRLFLSMLDFNFKEYLRQDGFILQFKATLQYEFNFTYLMVRMLENTVEGNAILDKLNDNLVVNEYDCFWPVFEDSQWQDFFNIIRTDFSLLTKTYDYFFQNYPGILPEQLTQMFEVNKNGERPLIILLTLSSEIFIKCANFLLYNYKQYPIDTWFINVRHKDRKCLEGRPISNLLFHPTGLSFFHALTIIDNNFASQLSPDVFKEIFKILFERTFVVTDEINSICQQLLITLVESRPELLTTLPINYWINDGNSQILCPLMTLLANNTTGHLLLNRFLELDSELFEILFNPAPFNKLSKVLFQSVDKKRVNETLKNSLSSSIIGKKILQDIDMYYNDFSSSTSSTARLGLFSLQPLQEELIQVNEDFKNSLEQK